MSATKNSKRRKSITGFMAADNSSNIDPKHRRSNSKKQVRFGVNKNVRFNINKNTTLPISISSNELKARWYSKSEIDGMIHFTIRTLDEIILNDYNNELFDEETQFSMRGLEQLIKKRKHHINKSSTDDGSGKNNNNNNNNFNKGELRRTYSDLIIKSHQMMKKGTKTKTRKNSVSELLLMANSISKLSQSKAVRLASSDATEAGIIVPASAE